MVVNIWFLQWLMVTFRSIFLQPGILPPFDLRFSWRKVGHISTIFVHEFAKTNLPIISHRHYWRYYNKSRRSRPSNLHWIFPPNHLKPEEIGNKKFYTHNSSSWNLPKNTFILIFLLSIYSNASCSSIAL